MNGQEMYQLCDRLFPICRSITGEGVRETLRILQEYLPALNIFEVPSGTSVFDWEVPKEWNIRDAYIENETGEKIISFKDHNLHVLGYSLPVDTWLTKEELLEHIYVEESNPEAIPYVTSYYKERYGFCRTKTMRDHLSCGRYHAVVDSTLENGSLTYGELIIPGDTQEEILLSTYICHPSMANNELSGPAVMTALADYINSLPNKHYTYRILFIPETIGSITYLSIHLKELKEHTKAGFLLSCVGDDRAYSYIPTRKGNTLSDRVLTNVLNSLHPEFISYSFHDRGSDERQYNAPGVDLPVCVFCRSKFGAYPEYHTSNDNMDLISAEGLVGAFKVMQDVILALEYNKHYKVTCLCEPQLGKRGLYPTVSKKGSYDDILTLRDLLAYADGENDLLEISKQTKIPVREFISHIDKLIAEGLLTV